MKAIALLLSIGILSCSETKKIKGTDKTPTSDWDTTFYAPKIGEKLIYRESIRATNENSSKPLPPQSIQKDVITRTRVYEGQQTIEGTTLHSFSVYVNNQYTESLLFMWDGERLSLTNQNPENPLPKDFMSSIPIAHINMAVGSYLPWSEDAPVGSGSRVIAEESVKVPAGTYRAFKISITTQHLGETAIKDYWFAPKVGIIKGLNRTYSGGLLRHETLTELIDQVIPGQEPETENEPSS